MDKKKLNRGALLGAAFLMATSAIGPGFLTQTATFTGSLGASFGFVILVSLLMSAIAQLNIWRVLCSSGKRGQDVANELLKGLGYFLAALIALGGLAFNIGNVGGGALGFNALLGIPDKVGCVISGLLAIVIFLSKQAKSIVDQVVKYLGAIMIVVILVVMVVTKPPVGEAVKNTFLPSAGMNSLFPAILTLLGGTVGGYITFAGAHRLIDAGVTGKDRLSEVNRSSVMGICIAAVVRVLLFLAVLGVVTRFAGINLSNPSANAGLVAESASTGYKGISNPAAYAFLVGAGSLAYRFAGLVILCAAVTSIIGAAYTSVSFLKTFHKSIAKNENWWIIGFIAVSTLIMTILGGAAKLLVLAGAVNGLILPISLGVCLVAAKNKKIMGEDYKHPTWLWALGVVVVLVSAYVGVTSLGNLANLFA
ncbi:MAG: divalent metal cation transporter [Oscillospiraceae bacterium]|nr:divalent metal cation transporter [Oscillospiraceae bacterium]